MGAKPGGPPKRRSIHNKSTVVLLPPRGCWRFQFSFLRWRFGCWLFPNGPNTAWLFVPRLLCAKNYVWLWGDDVLWRVVKNGTKTDFNDLLCCTNGSRNTCLRNICEKKLLTLSDRFVFFTILLVALRFHTLIFTFFNFFRSIFQTCDNMFLKASNNQLLFYVGIF